MTRIDPASVVAAYEATGHDHKKRFVLRPLAEVAGYDDPWEYGDRIGAEYSVGLLHGFSGEPCKHSVPQYKVGYADGQAAAKAVADKYGEF